MIKLIEVIKDDYGTHPLIETFINPSFIIRVVSCPEASNDTQNLGLDKRVEFSKIYLSDGKTGIFIGSPDDIYRKINNKKKLIKG